MDDLIDFALMRQGEMADAIEKRETEIEKLREQKENLEVFVATAKELAELSATEKHQENVSDEAIPIVSRVLPVRQAKAG